MDERATLLLEQVNRNYLGDELKLIAELCRSAALAPDQTRAVKRLAAELIAAVRADPHNQSALDRLLREYSLASDEGVLLMCLAEAFQRIPDSATADALINDKLAWADWAAHLDSDDVLINATTWACMLGSHVLPAAHRSPATLKERLLSLLARIGEPVARAAIAQAMTMMSEQFVIGTDINAAFEHVQRATGARDRVSFDMLGEAAITASLAEHYCAVYSQAIERIAAAPAAWRERSGISVKLSALYPRVEPTCAETAVAALTENLGRLAALAAANGIALTVDAEESRRLTLCLQVFANLARDPRLAGWNGLGIAVQAYQKRAGDVIQWLYALGRDCNRVIPVRLVKGAYWDSEIKLAQLAGLADFPVFTRKCHTDVAYLACARYLLAASPTLYPQFATHNAYTVASILCLAAGHDSFEFQRLYGMGEALYRALGERIADGPACRIYAPVGEHAALLPYLIRRLLENGANTSFVHHLSNPEVPVETLLSEPVATTLADHGPRRHAHIALPQALYGPARRNSVGHNFADPIANLSLLGAIKAARATPFRAAPVIDGQPEHGHASTCVNPAATEQCVGTVEAANVAQARRALDGAQRAWLGWSSTPAHQRAQILETAADLFEQEHAPLLARIVCETGRTLHNAHAELREAVDFLRFYALECRRLFAKPTQLPGPVGEANSVRLRGRGVFACISPWNFPLAIFTGQIAGALAAGNTVIAKPAEQASLTAARAVELLHEAGVPGSVLHFLPGDGAEIAAPLLADPRLAGVAFTGSGAVANDIAARLGAHGGPPATLIAETGGINALLADSSALLEQLVEDVVHSAFDSAGQRCSALRILCVQKDIAAQCLALLSERVSALSVGDPLDLATEVGPMIDATARAAIADYVDGARRAGRVIAETPLGPTHRKGHFLAPVVIRVDSVAAVDKEIFGPVLHVYEFDGAHIDATVDAINALGYGLCFGIHSRINARVEALAARSQAGNVYVNRNIIGAVVEAQPFGGQGLSGTGPKAGGYHYLQRFAAEQSVSVNSAAAGGNPGLLALDD